MTILGCLMLVFPEVLNVACFCVLMLMFIDGDVELRNRNVEFTISFWDLGAF